MIHIKSDSTATVFIRLESAVAYAAGILSQHPKARANVVQVMLHETGGGATYGHAVRWKELQGAWQLA